MDKYLGFSSYQAYSISVDGDDKLLWEVRFSRLLNRKQTRQTKYIVCYARYTSTLYVNANERCIKPAPFSLLDPKTKFLQVHMTKNSLLKNIIGGLIWCDLFL